MRDWLRSITPTFVLESFRQWKKANRRKAIEKQYAHGAIITVDFLADQLKQMGIKSGDTLLVHTAMSRMGALKDGPKTLVDALMQTVGKNGHILMPTSPNPAMQLNYIESHPRFDVQKSPSKMGAVTEYFRQLPGVVRSWSPTEPVSAWGPDAEWFVEGHAYKSTPYDADSPFARLAQRQGKILYIGVTLINAGTSLHLLEDAVEDFPLAVYHPKTFPVTVVAPDGQEHHWSVKVHNPDVSVLRRCDDLLPLFEREGIAQRVKLGQAPTWLFDAQGMYEAMLRWYEREGTTMYSANN